MDKRKRVLRRADTNLTTFYEVVLKSSQYDPVPPPQMISLSFLKILSLGWELFSIHFFLKKIDLIQQTPECSQKHVNTTCSKFKNIKKKKEKKKYIQTVQNIFVCISLHTHTHTQSAHIFTYTGCPQMSLTKRGSIIFICF